MFAGIYNKKQPPLKGKACPSDYQPTLVGIGILDLVFRYFNIGVWIFEYELWKM